MGPPTPSQVSDSAGLGALESLRWIPAHPAGILRGSGERVAFRKAGLGEAVARQDLPAKGSLVLGRSSAGELGSSSFGEPPQEWGWKRTSMRKAYILTFNPPTDLAVGVVVSLSSWLPSQKPQEGGI